MRSPQEQQGDHLSSNIQNWWADWSMVLPSMRRTSAIERPCRGCRNYGPLIDLAGSVVASPLPDP